jgi:diguanylate cyclase (GGDEF)-like protein
MGASQTLRALNAHLNRELIELASQEAQARDFAYHDELTRLPNRRLLRDRLEQALAHAARQRKEVALLLLDLDGFKSINDRLGHARGDKLLQAVAQRLQLNVRGADTACRYGGDEFVIMLPEVDNAWRQRCKLHTAMEAPLDRWVRDSHGDTIGSAVCPENGHTEELMRKADGLSIAVAGRGQPLACETANRSGPAPRCRPGRRAS